MKNLNAKKITLAVLVLLLVVIFFALPNRADADIISEIAGGAVAQLAFVISYIITIVLGAVMSAAGFLASVALNLNYFVISKANSLVGIGWTIVRDIANLGFVLVIVIMSFATILRFEKYGYQKILPKLIAAAILINFSLTIAGVFIDFANVLTHFFFDRISQNPAVIAETVAGAFNHQRLFAGAPDPNTDLGGNLTDSLFLLVAQPVFTAVFMLIAIFTMAVFAFLLLLRFMHLTFLLIIAPMVWLFWVIPDLSKKFQDWWDDFLKWLFFAPAAAFFMYLALRALEASPGFWEPADATKGNFLTGLGRLENIIIQGAQMVVLAAIMLFGLIIAQKVGIAAAGTAVNWAGKMKGKAQGWAALKTKQFGQRALTAGVSPEGKTRLEQWGAKYGHIPLIGRAFTGISGLSSQAKASLGKRVDDQYTKAKERTAEDNINALNQATPLMSPEELAGRGIRVAEKGWWASLNPAIQQKVINSLKQTGKHNDVLAYRPDLAVNFKKPGQTNSQAIEEAMAKYVSDATKLTGDMFNKDDIAVNLKSAHVSQLGNNGTDEQKQNVVRTLQTAMGNNWARIDGLLKQLRTARGAGARQLQTQLDATKTVLATDKEKKAFDTYTLIRKNADWQGTLPY